MVFRRSYETADFDDLEGAELKSINMSMPVLKEIGGKWLVGMAEFLTKNPRFIVNGFLRSGITGAIDGIHETDECKR